MLGAATARARSIVTCRRAIVAAVTRVGGDTIHAEALPARVEGDLARTDAWRRLPDEEPDAA